MSFVLCALRKILIAVLTIRFRRLGAWGSGLEKSENDRQGIPIRSRLELVAMLCFLWVAGNSNRAFAIRDLAVEVG